MVDSPGRTPYGASDGDGAPDEPGWGSPMPAEYGSLRAVGPPPTVDDEAGYPRAGRRTARTRQTGERQTGERESDRPAVSAMLRRLQGYSTNGTSTRAPEEVPAPPEATTTRTRAAQPGFDRTGGADDYAIPTRARSGTGLDDRFADSPDDLLDDPARVHLRRLSQPLEMGGDSSYFLRRRERPSRRERKETRKANTVRTRALVRHVDIYTVARVSVVFWVIILVMFVFASVLLWEAANTFGTLPSMEKSIKTLFDLKSFTVKPTKVAEYTSLGGGVIALAGVLANILGALIYNLIADLVGGIRVEVDSFPSD